MSLDNSINLKNETDKSELLGVFDLKSLKFQGGYGRAEFKMKHGSFKVREKIDDKFVMKLHERDGAFILKDAGGRAVVRVRVTAGDYGKCLHFEQIEGKKLQRFWIQIPSVSDEHVYGCGECFTEFNLKGKTAAIWVAEHQNTSRIFGKVIKNTLFGVNPDRKQSFEKYETYYAQPTFITSRKYYVHVDSDAYMKFKFEEHCHFLYIHELPERIYFGEGADFEEVSRKLTNVLGRQPLLPEWVDDGIILAVQGDTKVIEKKLEAAEKADIPVAGVWTQDWCGARFTAFGRQVMWNWKWDSKLYENLDSLIEKMHEQGKHFLGYINPFIAIEGDIYKEAHEKGYCIHTKSGEDYLATTTTFPAAMIDFTNPAAYEWYKDIIKENMIDFGLDGWMADFGEYMPVDAVLFDSSDNEQTHNRWPAIWAQLNHEVLEETGKSEDIFFFTRAGHTKTVKYSMMMWNGDQHVDWSIDDGLPSAILATLSLAMSGFGCTHSDIGGYTTMPKCCRDKELLMRWAEFSAFTPAMRCHEGNRPTDNVQFDADEDILSHFSSMAKYHVKLKKYIRACIMQNHKEGIPVMRPLFYHYDEPQAYDEAYSYLLGRDLLCSPVTVSGQIRKEVYLPNDQWVHLFTGETYEGGKAYVDCPMGQPPVFYRKNSEWADFFKDLSSSGAREKLRSFSAMFRQ